MLCNLYHTCNHYCTILTNALQGVWLSNKYIHNINFFTLNFIIVCQTFISLFFISYDVVHILILLYCIGQIENYPKIKCFVFQKYKTKRFWKCTCNCNCSDNLKNRDLIIYRRITFVVKYLIQFLLLKVIIIQLFYFYTMSLKMNQFVLELPIDLINHFKQTSCMGTYI